MVARILLGKEATNLVGNLLLFDCALFMGEEMFLFLGEETLLTTTNFLGVFPALTFFSSNFLIILDFGSCSLFCGMVLLRLIS